MTVIVGSIETIKPWQYIRIQNISTTIKGLKNNILISINTMTKTTTL